MAKVLRTRQVPTDHLVSAVKDEIALLTRNAPCAECVEILFESDLYRRLLSHPNADTLKFYSDTAKTVPQTVMGFKYRVVHGPGVRPGSMAVITRTEIVFK